MNKRIKIISSLIAAILIAILAFKFLGKYWGIAISIVLLAIVWFGMSFSLAGPNNWDYLFGRNLPNTDPNIQQN